MIITSDDVENDSVPVVNLMLILANCAVFVYTFFAFSTGGMYEVVGMVPSRFVAHPDVTQMLSIFSSMFIHSGCMHLIGNLWALYLFGDNVEDRLGHMTYLVFYLACGLIAGLIQILSDPGSSIPCVGASGAIAGVMGAYLTLHPEANCNAWFGDDSLFLAFKTFKIPALLVIGGWFLLQVVLAAFLPSNVAGIAFFAHIGGFLSGVALLPILRYREYQGKSINVLPISIISFVCLSLLVWRFLDLLPGAHLQANAANTQDSRQVSMPENNTAKIPSKQTAVQKVATHTHHPLHQRHHHHLHQYPHLFE